MQTPGQPQPGATGVNTLRGVLRSALRLLRRADWRVEVRSGDTASSVLITSTPEDGVRLVVERAPQD
jgi:hypothetical protein